MELPLTVTNLHGPKPIRANEIVLYLMQMTNFELKILPANFKFEISIFPVRQEKDRQTQATGDACHEFVHLSLLKEWAYRIRFGRYKISFSTEFCIMLAKIQKVFDFYSKVQFWICLVWTKSEF